jgi:hypothetical protein
MTRRLTVNRVPYAVRAYANQVLDRAEQQPWIIPAGAVSLGFGLGYSIRGAWWGWPLLAAGLILAAVRPLGTDLRRRARLRQIRQDLASL